jgi:pimeloyl-ACP methyl ester carboxylesterase
MHGFSVPYYICDSNFYALARAGFRVLRFDAFGRGYSDRPDKPYDAALYRKQIAELLAALKIHSVQAMAGVSFGGPVVTDFAVHYPGLVQSLILVDPLLPGFGRMPDPEFWKQFNTALDPEQMVKGQLSDLKYPERFPDWTKQYRVQMQYKGFRRALISTRYHYAPDDTVMANYRALDALGKPVLLIWGREDITVPFRFSDTLQRILHTEFMPVDESAHLPQMEKPALINQKIISFLRQPNEEHPVPKP